MPKACMKRPSKECIPNPSMEPELSQPGEKGAVKKEPPESAVPGTQGAMGGSRPDPVKQEQARGDGPATVKQEPADSSGDSSAEEADSEGPARRGLSPAAANARVKEEPGDPEQTDKADAGSGGGGGDGDGGDDGDGDGDDGGGVSRLWNNEEPGSSDGTTLGAGVDSSDDEAAEEGAPGDVASSASEDRKKLPGARSCDYCSASFRLRRTLMAHLREHAGQFPFRCGRCEMRFRSQSQLITHERTHTGERPFACTFCPACFSRKYDLTVHMRTHTGERPYGCEVCGARFVTEAILKKHLLTHTGEQVYSCPECSAEFSEKKDLRRHKRREHTKEQSHSCSVCCAKFASGSELSTHMVAHTGEAAASGSEQLAEISEKKSPKRKRARLLLHCCSVCNARFTVRSLLSKHMMIHIIDTDTDP